MTKTTTMFLAVAMATAVSFAAPKKAADITVSGYTGATTLENFPVLVRISPARISGFAYADCATGGADISFQDAAGNALDFEIDTWDASGDSLVWVKVPFLSGNATKIVFRWKDTNPAASTPSATWSGYAGVWHLNEEEAGAVAISDSTENGVNGTAHSTSSSKTDGKVGRARVRDPLQLALPQRRRDGVLDDGRPGLLPPPAHRQAEPRRGHRRGRMPPHRRHRARVPLASGSIDALL